MSVVLLFLAATAGAVSGAPEPTAFTSKYALSLVTTNDQFYQHMPVPINVVVANLTDEVLRVGFILKPVYYKWVRIHYRRLPGEFHVLGYTSEWDEPGHPPHEMFVLNPRARGTFPLSLAADPALGSFIFERPGDYEVKLARVVSRSRDGARDLIETPPVRIHIETAPPSEAAALADWDVDLAIFAQHDGGYGTSPRFRRSVLRALKFIDAHPDSVYARALRAKTLETLRALVREGVALTAYEQDSFERLRRSPAAEQ